MWSQVLILLGHLVGYVSLLKSSDTSFYWPRPASPLLIILIIVRRWLRQIQITHVQTTDTHNWETRLFLILNIPSETNYLALSNIGQHGYT